MNIEVFFTEFLALIKEYSVKKLKKTVIITENWNSLKNAVIYTSKSVKNWIFSNSAVHLISVLFKI
jgi:hypothetical protein